MTDLIYAPGTAETADTPDRGVLLSLPHMFLRKDGYVRAGHGNLS
jgi:hypothetical protein